MTRKIIFLLPLIIVLTIIFYYSLHSSVVPDTLFGLKIGEFVYQNHSLPTKEIFSWSAEGRETIPYEWLAQTLVYLLNMIGGFHLIDIYVGICFIVYMFVSFLIAYRVFRRDYISSLLLSVLSSGLVFDFFVARPQIAGYLFLLLLCFFLYNYILHGKQKLIFTLPLTYLWVNSHASFILVPYFFFSLAILSFLYFWKDKTKARKVFKTLVLFGTINTVITLFPPLWYKPYQLLIQFFLNIAFLSNFVSEWGPSQTFSSQNLVYAVLVVLTLLLSALFSIKKKDFTKWILLLPFVIIILASFQASRHIPLGIISAFFILYTFLPRMRFAKRSQTIFTIVLVCLVSLSIYALFWQKKQSFTPFNPGISQNDIDFLMKNRLEGNMFNEFTWGGSLMYYLYPDYQIFFDGRADVYLCCELRAFLPLLENKLATREKFSNEVYKFLDKYQFSYLIINIRSFNPLEFSASSLLADTLLDDPNWKLVYFNDQIQILVKNDGKNRQILEKFAMESITPFRLNQYRAKQEQKAKEEYEKMLHVSDSGIAHMGLGQIYLSQKLLSEAQIEFEKALQLNPQLGRAHIGLAKILIEQNKKKEAGRELQKAITGSPYFGESYLLLGQLLLDSGNKTEAVAILKQGLNQNIDFITRQKIVQLINTLR